MEYSGNDLIKDGDNWIEIWWVLCTTFSKGDNGNFDAALKYGEKPISFEYTIKN